MVFGTDVAVVLRSRAGRNLLLQTHGVDLKLVVQGATEVANILENPTPVNSETVDLGPGQATALVCGQLKILGGRYSAVYRLANQVLILVISRAHDNIFTGVNLAASITKVLLNECKGPEITPDRVAKKYAMIYMAIDTLVQRGTLDVGQALYESVEVLEALAADPAKASKKAKAKEAAAGSSAGQRKVRRRLSTQADQLARITFPAPPELLALKPPQGEIQQAPPVYRQGSGMARPGSNINIDEDSFKVDASGKPIVLPEDDIFGNGVPPGAQKADTVLGFEEEDLFAQRPADGALPEDVFDPFSASDGSVLTAAQKLSKTGAGIIITRRGSVLSGAAGKKQIAIPPPGAPRPPSLQLLELWRAEVQGSRVLRAGLTGTVAWLSPELRTFSSSVPFRLLPPEFPDKQLVAALKAAQRSERGAKPGVAPGVFQADSYCHLPVTVPLLRYQLPATAYAAPLMAQATHTVLQMPGKEDQALVSIAIRYAVTGTTGLALGELTADLLLPPSFGAPIKMSPQGQYSSSQACGRWHWEKAEPGQAGVLSLLFKVDSGREGAAAAAKMVRGRLSLEGGSGQTLSGTALLQAPNGPATVMQDFEDYYSWASEVYVALAAPPAPAPAP